VSGFPRDRWRRVQELCDAIESLAPADRDRRLAELEPDAGLRRDTLDILTSLDEEEREQRALRAADVAIQASVASLPASIGPIQVDALIGSGGSADVYRGVRTVGGAPQVVAVKLYHRHRATSDDLDRVSREQRLLATLTHPAIVRFFDSGVTVEGRPYLVMELAAGQPITAYADAHCLPLAERLSLFLSACDAVESAHRLHILHLDLKPSNVVVTDDGHVKLLDFGTAKLADPTGPLTRTEPITLQYASPERLRGEPVSASCDVYSLGLVLAELCTGAWPFARRDSLVAIAERAAGTAATRPLSEIVTPEAARQRGTTADRLSRALDGDLEAVVTRALASTPDDRYATVAGLAADVRRCTKGEWPAAAGPPTLRSGVRRLMRRHAGTLVIAAGVVTVLTAVVTGAIAMRPRPVEVPPPPLILEARTSMRTPANDGTTVFDDFVWTSAMPITRVAWQGMYCAVVPDAEAPSPTATAFRVGFHPDHDGPDRANPLQSGVYPIGRVGETRVATVQAFCGNTRTGWGLYDYAVTLDRPFAAAAGVRYWLSIQAEVGDLQAGNPAFVYWGWRGMFQRDNPSIAIDPSGRRQDFPMDRAFRLSSR
jgi:tRNA A-37 threonylcarbamoyl transferase component Bud32